MTPKYLVTFIAMTIMLIISGCSSNGSTHQEADNPKKSDNIANIKFSDPSELSYTETQTPYYISPYDLLEIEVFQVPELSQSFRVNPNGYVLFPLIGRVKAAGLTQEKLQNIIATALKKNYLQNPAVTVFTKEYANQHITIGGDISSPGTLPITGQMTLFQAISKAGGVADIGKESQVFIFRKGSDNKMKIYPINIREIYKGQGKDPYLQNEDKVIVQRSGARNLMKEISRYVPFMGYAGVK